MEVLIKSGYKINKQGDKGFKLSIPRTLEILGVFKPRDHFDLYVETENGNLIFKPMNGKRNFNLTFKNEEKENKRRIKRYDNEFRIIKKWFRIKSISF